MGCAANAGIYLYEEIRIVLKVLAGRSLSGVRIRVASAGGSPRVRQSKGYGGRLFSCLLACLLAGAPWIRSACRSVLWDEDLCQQGLRQHVSALPALCCFSLKQWNRPMPMNGVIRANTGRAT